MKKLFSRRGESLTEGLVSIMIVALTASMLATMVTAAANISRRGNEAAADVYHQLAEVETQNGGQSGIVEIRSSGLTSSAVNVVYFGQPDGLRAYERGAAGP